jgi:hypothetical protein
LDEDLIGKRFTGKCARIIVTPLLIAKDNHPYNLPMNAARFSGELAALQIGTDCGLY